MAQIHRAFLRSFRIGPIHELEAEQVKRKAGHIRLRGRARFGLYTIRNLPQPGPVLLFAEGGEDELQIREAFPNCATAPLMETSLCKASGDFPIDAHL